MRIQFRILLIIKWCESATTDLLTLQGSILSLTPPFWSSTSPFEPLKHFDLFVDPDPAMRILIRMILYGVWFSDILAGGGEPGEQAEETGAEGRGGRPRTRHYILLIFLLTSCSYCTWRLDIRHKDINGLFRKRTDIHPLQHLKENRKKKCIYMWTLPPNSVLTTFWTHLVEDFSICRRWCRWYRWWIVEKIGIGPREND